MPEAQSELMRKYNEALRSVHAITRYNIDFMPGAIFRTSDTSESAATLIPGFFAGKYRFLRFSDGITVRHQKNPEKSGCEIYRDAISEIFAKFEDAASNIAKLAAITIYNPENCIVRLCAKFKIAPRYGDGARNEIQTDGGLYPHS